MNILIILSSLAIGMVIGMSFMAAYNAEMRKYEHDQLRRANAKNVYLTKKLKEARKQLAESPEENKRVIELLDFTDPYQGIRFGE